MGKRMLYSFVNSDGSELSIGHEEGARAIGVGAARNEEATIVYIEKDQIVQLVYALNALLEEL